MNPRGRPRNADVRETADADESMARTCHQLIMWGYPRLKTFAVVAAQARALIPLKDRGRQQHVKGERVKQIYQQWLSASGMQTQRWRYTKHWLLSTRPVGHLTVEQAARHLLSKKPFPKRTARVTDLWGEHEVEISDYMLHGDPDLTPCGLSDQDEKQGRKIGVHTISRQASLQHVGVRCNEPELTYETRRDLSYQSRTSDQS